MYRLQSVGVMSIARMMAAVHGAISLIFIPIMIIAAIAGFFAGTGAERFSGLLFIVMALILPFFYAAMGFVMGALMAVVYNFAARKLGGIEMNFVPAPLVPGTGLPHPYEPSQNYPPPV